MEKIILCIAVISAFVGCASAVNCTAMPNGVYELGCRSYAECNGGQVSIINCPDDKVYNNQTEKCDDNASNTCVTEYDAWCWYQAQERSANVAAPCGEMIDCSNKADGRYADKNNNCESWYTCLAGKFLGHNFCSTGTVFDETLVVCNWKDAVAPPCGSLTLG